MLLTHRQLIAFINGRLGQWVTIAIVPEELAAHIGANTTELRMELSYSRKLRQKHRLLPEHFHQIQLVINHGWAGVHRDTDLVFVYQDNAIFGIGFKLAVKTARDGAELWVKTFHKVGPADMRSKLKQLRIVRDHSK